MFLRPNHRDKDGKDHTYWSLVETVRTPDGLAQNATARRKSRFRARRRSAIWAS
jgi:hypothetical protein